MMACIAAALGVIASLTGIRASYVLDTPTAPTIVCVSTLLFIATNVIYRSLPWLLSSNLVQHLYREKT